jgi:hypothetical protein
VAASARAELRRRGLGGRVAVVGGSFFEAVPPGADAYLLKDILHDWDDERAHLILSRCRAAMAPGARLLVAEVLVEPDTVVPPGPWADLHMMTVCDGGRQRAAADFARLLGAAGLEWVRVWPTASPVSLVEARAP